MIRAAIFDIGNVLLKFNYLVAAERLRLHNGLEELPDREPIVEAMKQLESGQIQRPDFLRMAKEAFAHSEDDESFLEIWRDIFHPNLPMISFARELQQHLPLYLLSNINCIHQEHIFERYDFFSIFRDGAYSYRLGCLKPDPEIYRRCLEQFELNASEVILFDDMEENVLAARQSGWTAIQYDFRRHGEFLSEVEHLGLTPPRPAATNQA